MQASPTNLREGASKKYQSLIEVNARSMKFKEVVRDVAPLMYQSLIEVNASLAFNLMRFEVLSINPL